MQERNKNENRKKLEFKSVIFFIFSLSLLALCLLSDGEPQSLFCFSPHTEKDCLKSEEKKERETEGRQTLLRHRSHHLLAPSPCRAPTRVPSGSPRTRRSRSFTTRLLVRLALLKARG